jgi:hypothetical protein
MELQMGQVIEMWRDRDLERAFEAQEAYIRQRFGGEAADRANYGWAVIEGDTTIDISSKVYGHGVLHTQVVRSNAAIKLKFESFDRAG